MGTVIHPVRWLFVVFVGCGLVAGCKHGSTMGHACSASAACPVDYACVIGFDGMPQCMASCTINETICADHSACLALQPGPTHACYVGGDVAIGETCTSLIACVHTGICVTASPSATSGTCRVGCNLDGTVGCDEGACVATPDANNGYCSVGP